MQHVAMGWPACQLHSFGSEAGGGSAAVGVGVSWEEVAQSEPALQLLHAWRAALQLCAPAPHCLLPLPRCLQVIAVGPGKSDEEGKATAPAVSVGSTVLYQKYSGTEFEGKDGKQYIVIRDGDILAAMA